MITKKILTFAALTCVALPCAQAATVFFDGFDYTTDNALTTAKPVGGGWTQINGNAADIGVTVGNSVMWGNGPSVQYNYAVAVAAGDVITMDANIVRTQVDRYYYKMTISTWDGLDAGTKTLADTSEQTGLAALVQLSYTVTAADISDGRDHIIYEYSNSVNWGETADVTLGVTAVPEPSSAALLGLGGFALILRRRK